MIDVGSGPPVVLIPGIQGRWEWLWPAVDALERRCRVITFSLAEDRGSGRPNQTRGFDHYLDQIDEALTRAGLGEAAVCGCLRSRWGAALGGTASGAHPSPGLGVDTATGLETGRTRRLVSARPQATLAAVRGTVAIQTRT